MPAAAPCSRLRYVRCTKRNLPTALRSCHLFRHLPVQNIMYLIFTVASGFIVSPRSLQGGWLGCCESGRGWARGGLRVPGCQVVGARQARGRAGSRERRLLLHPSCKQPSNCGRSGGAIASTPAPHPAPYPPPHPPADYANPAAYFLQALVVNEFESSNWDRPAVNATGAPLGITEGQFYMQERWARCGCAVVALGMLWSCWAWRGPAECLSAALAASRVCCVASASILSHVPAPTRPTLLLSFSLPTHLEQGLLHGAAVGVDWPVGVGPGLHPAQHLPPLPGSQLCAAQASFDLALLALLGLALL